MRPLNHRPACSVTRRPARLSRGLWAPSRNAAAPGLLDNVGLSHAGDPPPVKLGGLGRVLLQQEPALGCLDPGLLAPEPGRRHVVTAALANRHRLRTGRTPPEDTCCLDTKCQHIRVEAPGRAHGNSLGCRSTGRWPGLQPSGSGSQALRTLLCRAPDPGLALRNAGRRPFTGAKARTFQQTSPGRE